VIYHVFANRSNAGDWLSALGIQKLLRPLEVTECLCDEPFVDETLARLGWATPADLIVIGGGGLFMDYFQRFWEGFLPVGRRVPFCIWGVGHCDMKWGDTRPSRKLVEETVRCSRFCVVRDKLTRDYLSGCDIGDPVPCPSVAALADLAGEGSGVLHAASYEEDHPEVYQAMRGAAQEFAGRTGRVFRETNNRIQDGSRRALDELIRLYARSDVVLSARLHGCILALALGSKLLAVSCDHKIESFMRAAGLEDWVKDYSALDQLPDRLEALTFQPSAPGFIENAVAANRGVAERIFGLIERARN
jgi:hypothetical protein